LGELFSGAGDELTPLDAASIRTAGPLKIERPDGQVFGTPSGKLEIYSKQLETQGVTPLPDWKQDEDELREAARWPLRLLTAPSYFQPHTAFEGVDFLKRREGPVKCILHPSDASARNLMHGDTVGLHNDRARVRMVLHVSDEVRPGVVLVPGQRSDEDDESGTVNMLCSDRFTDIGEGATYQSTYLDVSRWTGRVS
jgi:anaerobic selenocysteine-containing dehydrogenase